MRKPLVKLVATCLIAVWIVSAFVTFQQPLIGTVHAIAKEIKKEPSIHGNASALVNQYKKLQELGQIKKVVILSSQGTKQIQISYQGHSGKLSGTVNADGSLRTMTYQAKDFPYYTQQTLNQMKKSVQGDRGVTVFKTLRVFVNMFSPNAKEAEKAKVYGLFDPTPRLSPGKAIWRQAAIGSVMYSLHVTKDGVCTIKVWSQSNTTAATPSSEIRLKNEPTRYVLHYGVKEVANPYPEHYNTAELIGTMNGLKDQDKVAIIRFNNGKSDLHPLYAVFSIQSGILSSLYDPSYARNAMSEDETKFVFNSFVDHTHTLYIADLMNQKLARYDLPQKEPTNAIIDLEWIDGNTVGVEGHINPHIGSYYMLNVSSGIWSEPLHGIYFTWTQKGLFYAESFPYSNGGKSIKSADGTTLYSIDSEDSSIVEGLWFDEAGDRVVFFEQNVVNDKIILVVATLDGANPLHIDKRIPYEGAISTIKWTGENQLEISQYGAPKRVTINL